MSGVGGVNVRTLTQIPASARGALDFFFASFDVPVSTTGTAHSFGLAVRAPTTPAGFDQPKVALRAEQFVEFSVSPCPRSSDG